MLRMVITSFYNSALRIEKFYSPKDSDYVRLETPWVAKTARAVQALQWGPTELIQIEKNWQQDQAEG